MQGILEGFFPFLTGLMDDVRRWQKNNTKKPNHSIQVLEEAYGTTGQHRNPHLSSK